MTLVQANARVPEAGRAVLVDAAARMRADDGFIARLAAFLDNDAAGNVTPGRIAEIERRLEALELQSAQVAPKLTEPPAKAEPLPPAAPAPRKGDQTDIEDLLKPVPSDPVEPAEGEDADWTAKAAAITTTTGEGKGRKLTDAGQREVLRLHGEGLSNAEIGRRVGVSGTSVANFLKRYDGVREELLSG